MVLALCLIFAVTTACGVHNFRNKIRNRRRSSVAISTLDGFHNSNPRNLEINIEESEVEDSIAERQGMEYIDMVNLNSRPEGNIFWLLLYTIFILCDYNADTESLEYAQPVKRNTLIDLVTNEAYK